MISSGTKLPGRIRIGGLASIAASAVVLFDIPDYGVAGGIPARFVRVNRLADVLECLTFHDLNRHP